jgi:hypothetical protein
LVERAAKIILRDHIDLSRFVRGADRSIREESLVGESGFARRKRPDSVIRPRIA